jgi:putative copper resistance protein D
MFSAKACDLCRPLALSLTGHTALQNDWLGLIHVLNNMVHLLAGSFWLGSRVLLPASLALLQVPEFCQEASQSSAFWIRTDSGPG